MSKRAKNSLVGSIICTLLLVGLNMDPRWCSVIPFSECDTTAMDKF